MSEGALSEREAQILQAVVQCYITTAEPVGSRNIVKRFELSLSPATVRNVMADLEEAGFLQQVHTSSGRVPTDRGYRYYVDYLMRVQALTETERTRIEVEFSQKLNDADEVMRQTSQMLALITHQTGIVKPPMEYKARIRHIEVMPVSTQRVAVLVADSIGRVHTLLAQLDDPWPKDEYVRVNRFLNDHLRGQEGLEQLAVVAQNAMRSILDEDRHLAERALTLLNALPAKRPEPLYLEGATQLFEQPEFRDVERVREVFGFLGEHERLIELLQSSVRESTMPGASFMIGTESGSPDLKEISVVASPYHVGDEMVGVIGVLGPRRMPYPRLSAIVDYTAGMLSRFLTRLAG